MPTAARSVDWDDTRQRLVPMTGTQIAFCAVLAYTPMSLRSQLPTANRVQQGDILKVLDKATLSHQDVFCALPGASTIKLASMQTNASHALQVALQPNRVSYLPHAQMFAVLGRMEMKVERAVPQKLARIVPRESTGIKTISFTQSANCAR